MVVAIGCAMAWRNAFEPVASEVASRPDRSRNLRRVITTCLPGPSEYNNGKAGGWEPAVLPCRHAYRNSGHGICEHGLECRTCTRTTREGRFARLSVQKIEIVADDLFEVEHRADGVGSPVIRSLLDPLTFEPVVFDEANHRSLIREGMIHKVVLCPGRDYQQWLAWTISATALGVRRGGIDPGQSRVAGSAESRSREGIGSRR